MPQQLTLTQRVDNVLTPAHMENISAALPSNISPEKFRAAIITAFQNNSALLQAAPNSVINACMKCAADGLVPDNRQAAIVMFGKQAQYMPMVAGIISRARELSDFYKIAVEIVCKEDVFQHHMDTDPPSISHTRPDLDVERGEIIGAWVKFYDMDNRVLHLEVMDKASLASVKNVAKSKNVWNSWADEMSKKSVIRRGAKRLPMSDTLRIIIERDDEMVDVSPKEQRPDISAKLSAGKTPETNEGFNQDFIEGELADPEDEIGSDEDPSDDDLDQQAEKEQ